MQIAVVTFSSNSNVQFNLSTCTNKSTLLKHIPSVSYQTGSTHVGGALSDVRTHMFTTLTGSRPGVPHVLVVITEGRSDNRTETYIEADNVHHSDIKTFVIGVGNVDHNEIFHIASDNNHVITVANFDELQNIEKKLHNLICSGMEVFLYYLLDK